jgi:hypothetical protein
MLANSKQSLIYVLVLVVVVSGVGVGSMSKVSGTTSGGLTSNPASVANSSQVCISNINSTVQPQYVSTLHQMITMPSFIQYSNGRCWTWEGTFISSGPRYPNNVTFVFDHFSNTIWYSCGVPTFKMDAKVFVVPSYSGGNVTGLWIDPQSPPYGTTCGI